MQPLHEARQDEREETLFTRAERGLVWCASMKKASSTDEAAELLVNGFCVILFPKTGKALGCEVKTGEKRSPSAPEAENTVKGAKDAFTETLRTNTSLIRRHLRTPELRLEESVVGRRSLTKITVCWVEGLTDPELPARMKKRLGEIDIDGLLSPAAVEEYVTGSRKTAFPLLEFTERTDHFCQGLLDGQVGLLVDGLPIGYLAPVSFGRLMRSPEDRATDYLSASMLRILRYLALGVSLLLPGIYAAMAMFHQQMLPTKLLLSIIESKQDVPFSTLFEVVGLLCAFELLQQAGLHLPQAIGTAVSIIGGRQPPVCRCPARADGRWDGGGGREAGFSGGAHRDGVERDLRVYASKPGSVGRAAAVAAGTDGSGWHFRTFRCDSGTFVIACEAGGA